MCTAFCLNLCKKKSIRLKLFLPYKFTSQKPFCRTGMTILTIDDPYAVIGQSPWLSYWLVKVTDPLFTRRIPNTSFLRKVACYAPNRIGCTVLLVTHNFSASCRSEFACFHNDFLGVMHEKLCNFEPLLFEIGRTYLTIFLIYCRKNCALSVSINNQPWINVRKNRCSSNHTQLCFMWKSKNNFIRI